LAETAKILEKSLKEDIQQLNRCIVDKNAKISTLELFSKTNTDDLKKKNHELENIFKRARDEVTFLNKLFYILLYMCVKFVYKIVMGPISVIKKICYFDQHQYVYSILIQSTRY